MSATITLRRGDPRLERATALKRAADQLCFIGTPAMITTIIVYATLFRHWIPYDFHWSYYPAAVRFLSGGSPYGASHVAVVHGRAFVYPALAALLFAPFGLLGSTPAGELYMLLCFLMVPASLWAMKVRDWRLYGAALVWLPVVIGWQGGNVSVPVTLLVALAWRYRDRPAVAALIVAVAISFKPFVWPLWLFLIATRRFRAAALAVGWGVVVNLLAWAVLGFGAIRTYLRLSGEVTHSLWRGGYSALALAHHLGLGLAGAGLILLTGSALIAELLVHQGLRRQRDEAAMVLAVLLMLFASPLVWSHYFVLLLVPLAIMRPRLSAVWVLPGLMWMCPPSTTVVTWQVGLAWSVTAVCLIYAWAARANFPPRPPAPPVTA